MKSALVVLCVLLAGTARATPTTEHPLEDAAGVVPDSDEPALESELRDLRAAGVELGVMVVTTTGAQSIEAYARAHAADWATGSGKAALFVLAIADRTSRLEVSEALRPKFSDARAQSILDNIRGYLRQADYTGAIRAVISEVEAGNAGVAPDLESPHPYVPDPRDARRPAAPPVAADRAPAYEPAPRKRDYTPLALGAFLVGTLLLVAFYWARGRLASRATLTGNAAVHARPLPLEVLICVFLILGWIVYAALIVVAKLARGSGATTSSSSAWTSSSSGGAGASSGGSASSGHSGGGGGWSGGGASSSW